jgi:transcriptional regulator with XRE-family HTH domain
MTMQLCDEIRRRFRSARRAAKLSQEDVAAELGVTRQTVSNWEVGRTSPGLAELAKICALYGVSADLILYGVRSVVFNAADFARRVASAGRAESHHTLDAEPTIPSGL